MHDTYKALACCHARTQSLAREASSEALSFATVRPAVEMIRSDGAEIASIERYFKDTLAKYGKFVSLTHNSVF